MRTRIFPIVIVISLFLTACGIPVPALPVATSTIPKSQYRGLEVGYTGLALRGLERRDFVAESLIETASQLGVDLTLLEGGNRHTDVIDAIHSFIAEDVDVIALNPLISLDMFEIK